MTGVRVLKRDDLPEPACGSRGLAKYTAVYDAFEKLGPDEGLVVDPAEFGKRTREEVTVFAKTIQRMLKRRGYAATVYRAKDGSIVASARTTPARKQVGAPRAKAAAHQPPAPTPKPSSTPAARPGSASCTACSKDLGFPPRDGADLVCRACEDADFEDWKRGEEPKRTRSPF